MEIKVEYTIKIKESGDIWSVRSVWLSQSEIQDIMQLAWEKGIAFSLPINLSHNEVNPEFKIEQVR